MTFVDQHYRNQRWDLVYRSPSDLVPFLVRQTVFEVPKFVFESCPRCVGNDDIESA
jgi:hypothetical protein